MQFHSFITIASDFTPFAIFLRLGIATLAGVLVGFERGAKNKVAGIKTHVLVCIGAALCMVVGQYTYLSIPESADITRIGSGVVSGVGFLGVGTIIRGKFEVHGLTTAAGLWACACIGLSAGIGYIDGVLITLAFVMFTLLVLRHFDIVTSKIQKDYDLYVEIDENHNVKHLLHELRRLDVTYTSVRFEKSGVPGDGPIVILSVTADRAGHKEELLDHLDDLDYVRYIEVLGGGH